MSSKLIANATGTRDLCGQDLLTRQKIISTIRSIFQNMDAVELDTPVIELRSVVDKLYGEDFNKLVYELVDHGEPNYVVEETSDIVANEILRYDLTVPFARFCATNGVKSMRKYQIGKVYRRDKSNMQGGRYREFYQCDFDIVGDDMGSGIHDVEILDLLVRLMDTLLGKNNYKIKINHRQLLVNVLLFLQIESSLINSICSTIDKLDKHSWTEIISELDSKGVDQKTSLQLQTIFDACNSNDINEIFTQLEALAIDDGTTINSLRKLFSMLGSLGIEHNFEFDLSLARGMDYYTGIIYEVVYLNKSIMPSTIAAGGRYDNMIGKLKNVEPSVNIPTIGFSIGLERIARIIEQTNKDFCKELAPQIFVASIGSSDKVITERIKLCSELRSAGLNVIMSNKQNPKMGAQFDVVFNRNIKFMVIIGETEIDSGKIKVKEIIPKMEILFNRQSGIQYLIDNC